MMRTLMSFAAMWLVGLVIYGAPAWVHIAQLLQLRQLQQQHMDDVAVDGL